ncbi:MAG: fructose-bisphosphate aldolase class I [Caldilineaceae bacterium SB0662_bin_9]|uniref:Fructose-bisphosphate aldolase n=1 Tax=Caldilineaceae bacterium SB0662_bin_9 TaxID=2605258 RepID=A0A6B1DQ38_9CHLR|nr:fructose-bisphosphate aldolase class I [Caldilineaceae bacterium SB0666_bin_21]MYD88905.1 fructose-bisphosphate aldolase class I [Caldilineaceae bacterium SB0662_bin_9]
MNFETLCQTARDLVAPGKGILAADESSGTIQKRFDSISVPSTADNRRDYRELLFTTPGVEEAISGVILYDETLRQESSSGKRLAEVLADRNIIPGIKVDAGAKPLAGCPGESVTEGLDGLADRLAEYVNLGARFAKWRAVIDISDTLPSANCIDVNAHALARYAALCQEYGLVPIVEPEVLMDGGHGIDRCEEVTTDVLHATYHHLHLQGVKLEGTLLKPNMVLPGKLSGATATPEEVAEASLRAYYRAVPAAVPGIVFLSGGQSPEEATLNLNAMNALGSHPWELSFSYGRALQQPVLQAWLGEADNSLMAQEAFHTVAMANHQARYGTYEPAMAVA